MDNLSKEIKNLLLETDFLLIKCSCDNPNSTQETLHYTPLSERAKEFAKPYRRCQLKHPFFKSGIFYRKDDLRGFKITEEEP